MKKETITLKLDRVKMVKEFSRNTFAGVKMGSQSHQDKKTYNRKQKHKKNSLI